jgi:hypothetical protein
MEAHNLLMKASKISQETKTMLRKCDRKFIRLNKQELIESEGVPQ